MVMTVLAKVEVEKTSFQKSIWQFYMRMGLLLDLLFFAGKEGNPKIFNEFEIWPDRTTYCRVNCQNISCGKFLTCFGAQKNHLIQIVLLTALALWFLI